MRYYKVSVSGAPSVFTNGGTWTSHPGGLGAPADPGAQEIEFLLKEYSATTPSDDSTLVIKGVSWEQIGQAANLIDHTVEVDGGMAPGLPLATFQSRLSGMLVTGNINRCWGNWEGTEMSIGMIIAAAPQGSSSGNTGAPGAGNTGSGNAGAAGQSLTTHQANRARYKRGGYRSIRSMPFPRGPTVGLLDDGGGLDLSGLGVGSIGSFVSNFFAGGVPGLSGPLNLIHNLQENMPLSSAVQQTLSTAFPGANVIVAISSMLKLSYQDAGVYQNMQQYAAYLKKLSNSILGVQNYPGITISAHGNTIVASDKQTPITTGQIAAADLIGQPTWVDRNQIHVKTVLRSDIHISGGITLPPDIIVNVGPQANAPGESPQRTHLGFQGTFIVDRVEHQGSFRSASGDDWCTNIYASVPPAGANNVPGNNNNPAKPPPATNPQNPPPVPGSPPSAPPTLPSPQSMLSRSVRRYSY